MDPRRKRIYIIVSAVCLALAVGIFVWSQVNTPNTEDTTAPLTNRPTSAAPASGDYVTGYKAPAVFPLTDKFSTDVLNTAAFKNLQTYVPIDVAHDLGRPDPFNNY